MNDSEALDIYIREQDIIGKISDIKILVTDKDIIHNIEQNDGLLNLAYIQDLTCIRDNGDFEMYQGHSLSEVEL